MLTRGEEIVERRRPVSHDHDFVGDAALLEGQDGQLLVAGVVLDQQDDLVHDGAPGAPTASSEM